MASAKTVITAALAAAVLSSCGWMGRSSEQSTAWFEYRGWGPMANLETPYSPNESLTLRYDEELRDRAQHVAEVERARESVWVANAPLREQFAGSQGVRGRAAASTTR